MRSHQRFKRPSTPFLDTVHNILYLRNSMNTYATLSKDERDLLDAWEEIYKRGHLTFWVLLVVAKKPLGAPEIHAKIAELSADTFEVTEQSLYRALRRFYDTGLIEITPGVDKRSKQYTLSETGKKLLNGFIERNIAPLYSSQLQTLIKETSL